MRGSGNKNNNDNGNNNDLKDGQSGRLEKKETCQEQVDRNKSGLYTFEEYKYYMENNLKQRPGKKKKEYVTHTMGHYPRNV